MDLRLYGLRPCRINSTVLLCKMAGNSRIRRVENCYLEIRKASDPVKCQLPDQEVKAIGRALKWPIDNTGSKRQIFWDEGQEKSIRHRSAAQQVASRSVLGLLFSMLYANHVIEGQKPRVPCPRMTMNYFGQRTVNPSRAIWIKFTSGRWDGTFRPIWEYGSGSWGEELILIATWANQSISSRRGRPRTKATSKSSWTWNLNLVCSFRKRLGSHGVIYTNQKTGGSSATVKGLRRSHLKFRVQSWKAHLVRNKGST